MRLLIVILAMALSPLTVLASGAGALDRVEVSLDDKVSLQNGAKLFVNYCMSCHSAQYMRYNRMAADLEIPEDLVKKHMIAGDGKIGDPMVATMSKEDGEAWFGVPPPDLSLIGKLRDPEWLYTYLRTFYIDDSTASGWNNKVFPNVAMPHALAELQGVQKPVYKTETDDHGVEHTSISGFELIREGSMSPHEFDDAMSDLTNFLYYMGEPARMVRIGWGIWTMLFLAVFGILAYMLKKEYWRDVH
jgi:ubiquinol-cytochrome c reductase cytochrome c1 subunit